MNSEMAITPTNFDVVAVPLHDFDWRPLPTEGKVPVIDRWNELCSIPWDRDDLVATTAEFAGDAYSCGIASDHDHVFLDQDILDLTVAAEVSAISDRTFGPTPLTRIGRHPKVVRIFRCDARVGIRSRKIHPIEIMAGSGQIIAFGTHVDTRRPYTWPTGASPLTLSALSPDIPLITATQLGNFLTETFKLVGRTHYGGACRSLAQRGSAGQTVADVHQQLRLDAARLGFKRAAIGMLETAMPGYRHLVMWAVVSASTGRGWSENRIIDLFERHFAGWAAPGAAAGDGVSDDDFERALVRCFGGAR
jgi:hypothetical protein